MSKISDLAKTFQQNLKQEAQDIEQQAKSDIHELRTAINAELKQSEQKIIADIHAQQIRMSRAVFKPYLWSLGGLLALALVLMGVNTFLAWQTHQEWANYQEAKQSIEKLDEVGRQIQIGDCKDKDGKTVICVAIDPKSKQWGKNGEYRAILPRQGKK